MKLSGKLTLSIFSLVLLLFFIQCNSQSDKSTNAEFTSANAGTAEKEVSSSEPKIRISPGHIVMMATDLDATQRFYEEHLGFHTT